MLAIPWPQYESYQILLLNDLFSTCFTPSIQLVLVIYYFRTQQVNQQRLMISNIMNNDSDVTSFPSSDD